MYFSCLGRGRRKPRSSPQGAKMDRKLKKKPRPTGNLETLRRRMEANDAPPVKEFRRAIAGEEVQERRDELDELRELTPDPLASYRTKELQILQKLEAED
jgi:hypothetical protein